MRTLESGYTIRFANVKELALLSEIERAANRLFLNTPYAFLVDSEPLSIDFIQARFQAGQVWVAVDTTNTVVGFAVSREVDNTLYLQEIDVHPEHGQRGIGSALVKAVCAWAQLQSYGAVSLATFREIAWNAPFYSKLGFHILEEADLTPGLQQIRLQEMTAGLPLSDRVIMRCELLP
ncbi:GNAT family N-acetyltransferase [Leptolyngbya ohadii]|uniref:GNAT family N-acetyltransferase n=1 Tax=Leptolyngbya ohadii TaxID=1962290 RepID=UPI000B59FA7D|nr:GNAT family N-acetyltransferase [Leptolyngbya ohadii]